MSPPREVFPTKAAAAAAVGRKILTFLTAARDKNGAATLAVSGGSTPRIMFESMAASGFDWRDVHLFWVDERCVPPGHPDSNYGMTKNALLDRINLAPSQVHRVQGELPPDQAAEAYVREIDSHFRSRRSGLPRFDVLHLGMGADAHTASLFPGDRLINDREHVARAIYSEAHGNHRVTLLPGVLLNAVQTVLLVTGEDKAAVLDEVFTSPADPLLRPAQLFTEKLDGVTWILDAAAAARLA